MTDPNRLELLEPLIGTWKTEIEMFEGDQTSTHHATDTYRWALGRHFIFHDVAGQMGGQKLETLEIIGVKGPKNFTTRSYDNSGAVDDYTASMDNGHWTIEGEKLRFDGRLSDDLRELSGEWRQLQNDRWERWLNVTLRKVEGREGSN